MPSYTSRLARAAVDQCGGSRLKPLISGRGTRGTGKCSCSTWPIIVNFSIFAADSITW